MRVALVCPYSLSRPGGVQGQVLGLARALREREHVVAVLAPRDEGPIADSVDGGNGTFAVGRSVGVRSNGSVAPVCLSPLAATRTVHLIEAGAFDVVHLHEPFAPLTGYGCLAKHDRPLVGTFHRSGSSPWYRALGGAARWALGRLDASCAVSSAALRTIEPLSPDKVGLIFNAVDVERLASADPWPALAPTILFLGRHEARKGLGVLLEAFASIEPGPVLWIGGDGPLTSELRRRFPESPRVQWLGVLDEDEKARRLRGADVLCAPSLHGESFGVVLLEAMAAGCSVVASDLDGYRDAAGGCAELAPPGDTTALGEALRHALADARARTGRSSEPALGAARDHAGEWGTDRLALCYLDVYDAAAKRFASLGAG